MLHQLNMSWLRQSCISISYFLCYIPTCLLQLQFICTPCSIQTCYTHSLDIWEVFQCKRMAFCVNFCILLALNGEIRVNILNRIGCLWNNVLWIILQCWNTSGSWKLVARWWRLRGANNTIEHSGWTKNWPVSCGTLLTKNHSRPEVSNLDKNVLDYLGWVLKYLFKHASHIRYNLIIAHSIF